MPVAYVRVAVKVLFDCRFIRVPRHDGISRYTAGLVGELSRLHDVEMLICDTAQLALLPDLPWHLAGSPWSLREPFVARRIRKLRPDVVFSPLQTMGSWQRTYGLVLTLHDVIFHRHRTPPPVFSAPLRLAWRLCHLAWWPQRVLLDRADEVVTVSDTTARLMARHRLTRRCAVRPGCTPIRTIPPRSRPPCDPCRTVSGGRGNRRRAWSRLRGTAGTLGRDPRRRAQTCRIPLNAALESTSVWV